MKCPKTSSLLPSEVDLCSRLDDKSKILNNSNHLYSEGSRQAINALGIFNPQIGRYSGENLENQPSKQSIVVGQCIVEKKVKFREHAFSCLEGEWDDLNESYYRDMHHVSGPILDYDSFNTPSSGILCAYHIDLDDASFSQLSLVAAHAKALMLQADSIEEEVTVTWPSITLGNQVYIMDQITPDYYEQVYESQFLCDWVDWMTRTVPKQNYNRIGSRASNGPTVCLNSSQSSNHMMPIEAARPTSKIIKDHREVPDSEVIEILSTSGKEEWIPVVPPNRISQVKRRAFIVDSGSSADVVNDQEARNTLKEFVRKTVRTLEFDTANDKTTSSHGIRAQIAEWDATSDYVMIKNSPQLISMGVRVELHGFNYVWLHGKSPFFLSHGGRYIIIMAVENRTPLWSPLMEEDQNGFGTFEFYHNIFREKCGVYINDLGQVCLDVNAPTPASVCPLNGSGIHSTSSTLTPKYDTENKNLDICPTKKKKDKPGSEIKGKTTEQVEDNFFNDPEAAHIEMGADIFGDDVYKPLEEDAEEEVKPPSGGHAAPEEDAAPAAPVPPPPDSHPTVRMKSKKHCLLHYPTIPGCPGCEAKTRNKKHYKTSFDRNKKGYERIISMDHVHMSDKDGTTAIGGFKYALVLCKIKEDYWDFVPCRTLDTEEAERIFTEFVGRFGMELSVVLVYCDGFGSLKKVCDRLKVSKRHPPPNLHHANSVIERKIGVALEGIRAYLNTAFMPNCFWNFAGHCFAFNKMIADDPKIEVENVTCRYTLATGEEFLGTEFVFGQLVFFKPSPTIYKPAKTDNPLSPGIFLDYYVDPEGKFTGQYLVCDLDDFKDQNLHHRCGSFKLHIHRTEVVKEPAGSLHPIFPLKNKFIYHNYDLDGLELKPVPPRCEIDNHATKIPSITQEELAKPSYDFNPNERYKIDMRGRRLPVDESGKWIKRSKHWQPLEVPD